MAQEPFYVFIQSLIPQMQKAAHLPMILFSGDIQRPAILYT